MTDSSAALLSFVPCGSLSTAHLRFSGLQANAVRWDTTYHRR